MTFTINLDNTRLCAIIPNQIPISLCYFTLQASIEPWNIGNNLVPLINFHYPLTCYINTG